MNDEAVVRARLHALAGRAHAGGVALGALASVDLQTAERSAILEATERAIDAAMPAYYPTTVSLMEAMTLASWVLIELLIVQSIAARQGRWPVRELELADARTARDLIAPAGPRERLPELVAAAGDAYRADRPEVAAGLLVEADAIERSPVLLLQLAVALWRAGRIAHALHAVRACLLEEPARFPSPDSLLSAVRVESSLRRVADGRGVMGPREDGALAAINAYLTGRSSRTSWTPVRTG